MTEIAGWVTGGGAQSIIAAASGLGVGGVIVKLLDHRRAKRAQSDHVALDLVEKLQGRVETLERQVAVERESCEAKLTAFAVQIEAVRVQASVAEQAFEGLLLAIEMAPERAAEVVARMREKRAGMRARTEDRA